MHKILSSLIISLTFFIPTVHAASTEDEYSAVEAAHDRHTVALQHDPFLQLGEMVEGMSIYMRTPNGTRKEIRLVSMCGIDSFMFEVASEKYEEYKSKAPPERHEEIDVKHIEEYLEDMRILGALLATRVNPERVAAMGDMDGSRNWIMLNGFWFPRDVAQGEELAGVITSIEDPIRKGYLGIMSQNKDFATLADTCLDRLRYMPRFRARMFRESYRGRYVVEEYVLAEEAEYLARTLPSGMSSQSASIEDHLAKLDQIARLKREMWGWHQKRDALGFEIEALKEDSLADVFPSTAAGAVATETEVPAVAAAGAAGSGGSSSAAASLASTTFP